MKKRKAVIFGAGEWGNIAFFYYKEKCNIEYYIDNDKEIWGKRLNNLEICSPNILNKDEYTVIIANKRHEEEILTQIKKYDTVNGIVIFRIQEEFQEINVSEDGLSNEELIVAFQGGLGNQMFQYALYRNFLKQEKNVKADLSSYTNLGVMPFQLENVFPNIKLSRKSFEKKEKYIKNNVIINNKKLNYSVYFEPNIWHYSDYKSYKEILNIDIGYIEGYHQTYFYADLIQNQLKNEFCFKCVNDQGLEKLKRRISENESISIHIRRGDYLIRKYKHIFGNICTEEYYDKAIALLKDKVLNPFFVFFSNDIKWVKENLIESNAIYIEEIGRASCRERV